ncbi:TetR/AcrR family transcriptional regulator [Halocynthiibacter styelae]|uniref:TetR/AcrR family transcriptional regulator n=1 Tax=Halocynthiibacter styelae TaxID=2761955 RepID=UPI001E6450F6|nr:TetR/AcrR family transcriptional regulator [Paenihalocynthiibacter styelae]
MTTDTPNIPRAQSLDPKVKSILEAAFTCFMNYGVQRTSMADIAKAAGMSRPALYLHFPNKDAILEALISGYFTQAAADMADALRQAGSAADCLLAAMLAKDGEVIEKMMLTPHGPELLDLKQTVAREVVAAGEDQMRAVFAIWVKEGVAAGSLTLARTSGTAEGFANTLLLALLGLKAGFTTIETYREGQRVLAESFGAMIEA